MAWFVKRRRANYDDDLFDAIKNRKSTNVIRRIATNHPHQVMKRNKEGQLPLHFAFSKKIKSFATIRLLVEQCPEAIREKDNRGQLALYTAIASQASIPKVRFLIEQYPEGVREKNNEGRLPLHVAAQYYSNDEVGLRFIRFLVKQYPESIRVQDYNGYLPLHDAAKYSCEEFSLNTLRFFVKQYSEGIRVKAGDKHFLPLHCALLHWHASLEKIQYLVQQFPDSVRAPIQHECLPLHLAACIESVPANVVFYLMQLYPHALRIKDRFLGHLPLHHAANSLSRGNPQGRNIRAIFRHFVQQYPVSVAIQDDNGYLPLHYVARAAFNDDDDSVSLKVIRFLVKQFPHGLHVPTHTHGSLPVHLAVSCVRRDDKAESWWIKARKHIHETLQLEIVKNLVEKTKSSLSESPIINCSSRRSVLQVPDKDGYLPLHRAVKNPCTSLNLIRYLVEQFPQGVRQSAGYYAYLPLHLALGGVDGMDDFSNHNHDNNDDDNDEKPSKISMEIIQFLVETFPESVKKECNDGYLPLHYAAAMTASRSSLDVIRYLVKQFPHAVQEPSRHYGELLLHLAVWGNLGRMRDYCSNEFYDHEYHEPSMEVIEFLVQKFPKSVSMEDHDGYLPLHRAVMMMNPSSCAGTDAYRSVFWFLLRRFPQAIRRKTKDHQRYLPLHLALMNMINKKAKKKRGCNNNRLDHHASVMSSINVARALIDQYPQALQVRTRDGLLPVVLAAEAAPTISATMDSVNVCLHRSQLELIYVCIRKYPNTLNN